MSDRRVFFQETIGKLLNHVVERAEKRVAPKRWFRPPGAAPEMAFVGACTRCGDCIDVCPVHAILKMPANGGGLATGTPYIDPSVRACMVCADMPCAAACETGALTKVPWESVHMGVLELDPLRCITFQGAACGVCARACPVGERALALDDRGRPVLKPEGCVGCGVCVTACVTSPSSLKLRLA
ncbi:MAG TPA: 4Fe-4S dicluster domain-containing protein [Gemmatimonadales bacterium]|nr:4Fe-4S dicluster domain-containing protein [Gemmatimonadales bacterium]